MKWLFLLLLAANLALYFWTNEPATDDQAAGELDPHSTELPADTPTILLIEEAREQKLYPRPEQITATNAPAEVAPTEVADPSATTDADRARTSPAPPPLGQRPTQPSSPPSTPPSTPRSTQARRQAPPQPTPPTTDLLPRDRNPQPAQTAQQATPASAPQPGTVPAAPATLATAAAAAESAEAEAASHTEQTDSVPPAGTSSETNAASTPSPEFDDNQSSVDSSAAAVTDTEPTTNTAISSAANQAQCFRLGPFETLTEASMAQQGTMELGFSGRLLQANRGKVSYQVLLGPYEDPDERLQTMNELFDAGVGDILIGEGSQLNDLIAGSFPSRESAAEKLNQLEELGYKPLLSRQSRAEKRFYLDLNTPDSSGSPPAAELLKQEYPDTGVKPTRCRSKPRS